MGEAPGRFSFPAASAGSPVTAGQQFRVKKTVLAERPKTVFLVTLVILTAGPRRIPCPIFG
ncbi:MAG TPA: hypothetical protein VGF55_34295, partial [Gemmataceae bacterium]